MNMSHCRFENTLSDLKDCYEQLEALFNGELCEKMSSMRERQARVELVELCEVIADRVAEERRLRAPEGSVADLLAEMDADQEDLRRDDQ